MRPRIPLFLAIGLSFAAGSSLRAATQPKHLDPSAPRTVTVSQSGTPPVVRAGLLQSTLILLPAEEKVASVFAGDTVDWVFDGGHIPSRFISIKPKVQNSSTDVHIVSDHGNQYTLELDEISNDEDSHYDSEVLIVPGDKDEQDRITAMPVFVPAAELDKARQDGVADVARETAAQQTEKSEEESYRSQYPATLHFDYTWDKSKAKSLGLEQIWRDERFTYLRGQFQETPALYEVKDKKPSLINFDFASGLYTVPKELDKGYLAIGKQKIEFQRNQEGK